MPERFVVLKFGGSSVSEARHWHTIAQVVRERIKDGLKPVLVLSALKNVTNMLEALLHQAKAGVHHQAVSHLRDLHCVFASELGVDGERVLTVWFSELESVLSEIAAKKSITPKLHARVLATGELLSSTLGAAFLHKSGLPCRWMDARRFLRSEQGLDPWHAFVSATCRYEVDATLRRKLADEPAVAVTQGFIASNSDGETVLLGREGSDSSAAYLAAIINAQRVEIWTDVPGIFTANPREIPEARQLLRLGYDEAQRLSQSGAKVLHERALQPLCSRNIPADIRCTWRPQARGTLIAEGDNMTSPFAVSQLAPVTWLRLTEKCLAPRRRVLPTLLGEGYDLVVERLRPAGGDLVLNWANSDTAEPDRKTLLQTLQTEDASVDQQLACLSVLGPLEGDWQNALEAFVDRDEALIGGVRGRMKLPGRWVVLVEQRLASDWLRRLHNKVLETGGTHFGPSWQALHGERS